MLTLSYPSAKQKPTHYIFILSSSLSSISQSFIYSLYSHPSYILSPIILPFTHLHLHPSPILFSIHLIILSSLSIHWSLTTSSSLLPSSHSSVKHSPTHSHLHPSLQHYIFSSISQSPITPYIIIHLFIFSSIIQSLSHSLHLHLSFHCLIHEPTKNPLITSSSSLHPLINQPTTHSITTLSSIVLSFSPLIH